MYPGHEYTKSNAKFLVKVAPQDEEIRKLEEFAEKHRETQGRFTIGNEKRHNLFMRAGTEEMRRLTGKEEPSEVLGRLREMKNSM